LASFWQKRTCMFTSIQVVVPRTGLRQSPCSLRLISFAVSRTTISARTLRDLNRKLQADGFTGGYRRQLRSARPNGWFRATPRPAILLSEAFSWVDRPRHDISLTARGSKSSDRTKPELNQGHYLLNLVGKRARNLLKKHSPSIANRALLIRPGRRRCGIKAPPGHGFGWG